jgi:peptide/nickel transport system substrate-binding protein
VHRPWALLLLAVAGCGSAGPPATVFYASGADLQSINPLVTVHPLARQVQRFALFVTLAQYDSALRPRPYLAERWSWSSDRRALDLLLRSDVRWHDGVPTTSADVVFTLDAARDLATGYPRAADLACLTDVRALDASTVRLSFCRPQSGLADVLTDLAILPVHLLSGVAHAALRRAPFNSRPVGNGPYRFVSHAANQRWIFEANPGFPAALGGPPAIKRLVIVVVDEPTTKLAGLVTGELDVAGIQPMHAALVRRDPALVLVDYPILLTYGLVWNTRHAPFDDPRLRRALTLALNRAQMVAAYLYGFGEVADGPVPPSHPLAVPVERVPFDRAAARALLDSLGWKTEADGIRRRDGRALAFTLLTVGASDNSLEQMIQADLKAVGAEVRIRQLELGAFLAAAQGAARDYDALVTGIPGDLSLGYLGGLFDSRRLDQPLQYAGYRSGAVDRALDAGDVGEVQRIVARDLPITFLYHARGVQGVNRRLKGVRMDLRGELATLQRWHLDPATRPPE